MNDITEVYDVYDEQISDANGAGMDFDCYLSWSDNPATPNRERHILHPLPDSPILEPSKGRIVMLEVGYSGIPKDWEETQAAQRDN